MLWISLVSVPAADPRWFRSWMAAFFHPPNTDGEPNMRQALEPADHMAANRADTPPHPHSPETTRRNGEGRVWQVQGLES